MKVTKLQFCANKKYKFDRAGQDNPKNYILRKFQGGNYFFLQKCPSVGLNCNRRKTCALT